MTEPHELANQLLVLELSTTPTALPDLEPLPQNQQVFKINARGLVTGALAGDIRQSITEVHSVSTPVHQGVAIAFTLETEQRRIEGYYSGSIH